MVALLPTVADHPLLARMHPPELVVDLLRLWNDRDSVFQALDDLPQTLCHQDVFPRNVFVRAAPGVSRAWRSTGLS